jgi:hypothetical protein
MWNVKAKVIPVITGANGTISKSFRQYLNKVQVRNQEITENSHSWRCACASQSTNYKDTKRSSWEM